MKQIIERAERAAEAALERLYAVGVTDHRQMDEHLSGVMRELATIRSALAELKAWTPGGLAGVPAALPIPGPVQARTGAPDVSGVVPGKRLGRRHPSQRPGGAFPTGPHDPAY